MKPSPPCRLWLALFLGGAFPLAATPPAPITALAYHPKGALLCAGGPRRLEALDPSTARLRFAIDCSLPKVASLAWHPGGRFLAVGGGIPAEQGTVRLLDWETRQWCVAVTHHSDLATAVAWHPAGTHLAVASADRTVVLWQFDPHSRELHHPRTLTGHAGPVFAAAFQPDGRALLTAGADRAIKVWSTSDGSLQRTLSQHTDAIAGLAFRPTQDAPNSGPPLCASVGDDRTLRVWQPAIGRLVRTVRPATAALLAVDYAPDGRTLHAAGREGILWTIDADSDAVLARRTVSADWIHTLAAAPDGRHVAVGDAAGQVHVVPVTEPGPPNTSGSKEPRR